MGKLPYGEGDVFAVPIRSGGYCLGVIARMAPKGKILLGYFFGPILKEKPSTSPLLNPDQAVMRVRFGDLDLFQGNWSVLGKLPDWNRERWPIPKFKREPDFQNKKFVVTYDPDDPSTRVSESPSNDVSALETDALLGSGAVEIRMTKLLGS